MEVTVVIPSAGRSAEIITHHQVANAIICIPESEYAAYKKAMPSGTKFDVHPDTLLGLANKRNYILEKYKNVFMLDDDINAFIRVIDNGQKMNKHIMYELIQADANICHQMGAYLFGFGNHPNPVMYRSQDPFQLTGYINGAAMGLLDGIGIKFDMMFEGVNDYYMCGMNAYKHRYSFIDKRIALRQNPTFKSSGGLSYIRNNDKEFELNLLLKKYFGEAIVQKKNTASYRVKAPNERTLKIPY